MSSYLQGPPPEPSGLLFDCVPSGPTPETPSVYDSYFSGVAEAEVEAGAAQMADAVSTFLTRERERKHTLLVTHSFVIGWFVREMLEMPDWRWLALRTGNAALTVLRLRRARPNELLVHNDQGHLPPELRTGGNWDLPI
ncbi:histidine phosphatase family protein [Pseudoclavibacter endophyticus]